MLRFSLLGVGAWLILAAAAVAPAGSARAADEAPVTCQMTTERVLKPFFDRLAAALAGQ